MQAGAPLELPTDVLLGENAWLGGWYTAEDYTGEAFTADTLMPQGSLTLYAQALPIFTFDTVTAEDGTQTLTITGWDARCGQSDAAIPESIGGVPVTAVAAGCFTAEAQRITVPACVLTLEEGWLPADWSGTIIAPADSAAALYAQANGVDTAVQTNALIFLVNGGASLQPVQAASGTLLALPVPVRTGYAFDGWYIDEALSTAAALDENSLYAMPGADTTLFAAWTLEDESAAALSFTCEETADGAILITGLAEGATVLTIPETLHGLPVTAIAKRAFAHEKALTAAAIPGSIATIPASAFSGCRSLAAVTLAEGVTRLGDSCFSMCDALTELTLPATLQTIDSAALEGTAITALHLPADFTLIASDALVGCSKLAAITVDEGNSFYLAEDGVLYDLVDDKLVCYPPSHSGSAYTVRDGTCVIGSNAFNGACLTQITLPDSVWSLEEAAFAGARMLTALPDFSSPLLTSIPARAFAGCHSLSEITIPESIRVIGSNAFTACRNLATVHIADTVMQLGSLVFPADVTLVGVSGSAAETYAAENALLFIDPDATVLPDQLTLSADTLTLQRGDTAHLTAALLPENATVTDVRWYSEYPAVVSVDQTGMLRALSAGVVNIVAVTGNGLTAQCTVTVDAAIPVDSIILNEEAVTLLASHTQQLTAALQPANATAVTLLWQSSDSSICTVDENGLVTAVSGGSAVISATTQSGLTACCAVEVLPRVLDICITYPAQQWKVGDTAVPTVSLVPADAVDRTLAWSVSPADAAAIAEDGSVTFLKTGYVTVTVTATELGLVSVSTELECVPESIWTLPAALTAIEDEAFTGLPVQAVILPDGMVSIGERAFADCAALYRITIPASVTEIALTAFDGCPVTILSPAGSYAQQWAADQGFNWREIE